MKYKREYKKSGGFLPDYDELTVTATGNQFGVSSIPDQNISSVTAPDLKTMKANVPDADNNMFGDLSSNSEGFEATDFLQFAPDLLNFGAGVFGKDKTRPATTISNRSVNMMPDQVNVSPQLEQARSAYRAILSDPNASANQKLAAQAMLNRQSSQIYADKQNREAQMQANKAQLQSQLDRSRSRYKEQERQDKMASDANLGLSGNFARQALTSASQKMLHQSAMENKKDQANKELLTVISAYPEAVQKRILEQLELNG